MSWFSKGRAGSRSDKAVGVEKDEAVGDLERGVVARYLARVFERGDLPLRHARNVLYWVNERREWMGFDVPNELSAIVSEIYSGRFRLADLDRAYGRHRNQLIAGLRAVADETPAPEPLAGNLAILVEQLGLSHAAWKVLGLIASYTRFDQVEYLCDTVAELPGPLSRVVAILVGEPARTVDALIAPSGALAAAGILQINEQGDQLAGHGGRYGIPWRVDSCLDRAHGDFESLRRAVLGDPLEPGLNLSDYDHVAGDRDLMSGVLEGSVAQGAAGVNILLHGPPGTGKTELTKIAAAAAGLKLYAAGDDRSGTEEDRSSRLSDLVFTMRLLSGSERAAILFDEMEDVAWQLIRRGGSKLYLNRLLETNPVPVLWTSNNIHEIDPAVLRRMTFAVELKLPPARQRERILARLDRRIGVGLSEAQVSELARRVDAAPAVLENALKAARFAGAGHEAVERAALGIVRAVSGSAARRAQTTPDFDSALTCADVDLRALEDRLSTTGELAFSLCLSGPPGTGKSAFARHLAGRLSLEVIHKRASDLLGAFVGESEKRIADAFEEAREAGAVLIFDEAESFLFDRRDASRSWEITQVNEMLTWMEDHPLPVCCTTNLMDRFDSASLRRFTFHIRFAYLDRAALKRAYAVFFHMSEVPPDGLALANLTPGDFAQARRQADVLGVLEQPARIVGLLVELSRAKPDASAAIGFVR